MRFLHCSDVHVTQDYFHSPIRKLGWRRWIALFELKFGGRARHYAQAGQTLRAIASDVSRHRADHLIVSGDLTAYATEAEFQGARAALSPLADDKRRCTVIPGNHDTYTPGSTADRRFERYFGHLLDSDLPEYCREGPFPFVRLLGDVAQGDGAAVVGLLSARVPLIPGFSFGRIGEAQLEGLKALISDPRLDGRAVLVVVHHAPLARSGRKDKPLHGLVDGEQLYQVVRGERFAVLHGHIHQRYHHAANEQRPHQFGAGSSTCEGREGYWLIDVKDGKIADWKMEAPRLSPLAPGEVDRRPLQFDSAGTTARS
jgi:3',5'-cyclic AMP phosphodiesterase CpdA